MFSLADLNGISTMCAQRREVSVSLGKLVSAATVRVAINSERNPVAEDDWQVRHELHVNFEIWSFDCFSNADL